MGTIMLLITPSYTLSMFLWRLLTIGLMYHMIYCIIVLLHYFLETTIYLKVLKHCIYGLSLWVSVLKLNLDSMRFLKPLFLVYISKCTSVECRILCTSYMSPMHIYLYLPTKCSLNLTAACLETNNDKCFWNACMQVLYLHKK